MSSTQVLEGTVMEAGVGNRERNKDTKAPHLSQIGHIYVIASHMASLCRSRALAIATHHAEGRGLGSKDRHLLQYVTAK
jgi:hypothetical protein